MLWLNSVKLNCITTKEPETPAPVQPQPEAKAEPKPEPKSAEPAQKTAPAPVAAEEEKPAEPVDAFARAEAIRAAALKKVKHSAPAAKKGSGKKDGGKAIFGRKIRRAPIPIGDLELDMGYVVVEATCLPSRTGS